MNNRPLHSRPYQNCMHSVLAPDFNGVQNLMFLTQVITGAAATLAVPIGLISGVGCIVTVVCGTVAGTLLTLGDVGLNIYKYINGDQSLSKTLLNLGTTALEALLFYGVGKLVGAGFRVAKDLYAISRAAKQADVEIKLINIAALKLKRLASCLTGGNSFTPGTPVLLADRTSKPIADVHLGDRVLATDPATGRTTGEPVSALITSTDTELTDLTIQQTTGQRAVLHTTPHHPFWTPGTQRWTDAKQLSPDATLHTPNGDTAHVTAVRTYSGRQTMHNLTVDHTHTYYVVAGDAAVLVHNMSCDAFPNKMSGTLQQELDVAAALGVRVVSPADASFDAIIGRGTIKWAVLRDGTLVVEPKFVDGQEISHAVLSNGDPVLAAGEADIVGSRSLGYWGTDLNNHSGHFQPSVESLQLGRDAFGEYGITFP
jgi:hypothetical protein